MDFFKNLFQGAKTLAGDFVSGISGAAQNIGSAIGSVVGPISSAISGAFGGPSQSASTINAAQNLKNIGIDPSKPVSYDLQGRPMQSTPEQIKLGQGTVFQPAPTPTFNIPPITFGSGIRTTTSGSTTSGGFSSPVGAAPGVYGPTLPRPMITTPGTHVGDIYGRVSSAESGNPYYTETGAYVIPKTGFTGVGGEQSQSFLPSASASGQGFQTPTTAAQGVSGGGSSFTGLLGATGTYGSTPPGTAPTSTDEQKEKDRKLMETFKFGATPPPLRFGPGISNVTQTSTPALSPYFQPRTVAPQAPLPSLQTPTVSATSSLTDLSAPSSPALKTSYATSIADSAQVNNAIDNNFNNAKAVLDKQYDTSVPLTTDTAEQLAAINNSGDPYGVRAALDAFKMSNTNLASLEASRIDVMKNLQALNEAYLPIIDDIKNNPDLPKGLAQRRLTQLNEQQKKVLLGFTNQLELLNQSISDQNQAVNRAFNIAEFASSQANRSEDNARQQLQLLISTGAIGGMSNAELNSLARSTGVTTSALAKARDAANDPGKNIITETDEFGNVRGIDKNTGKVIWSVSGAGKPLASNAANASPANQFTKTQVNTGAARAGISTDEFINLNPDVQNYFVSNPANSAVNFTKAISGLADGTENPKDLKAEISASQLTPTVKSYLQTVVDSSTPAQSDGGGFWASIGNFFGNLFK